MSYNYKKSMIVKYTNELKLYIRKKTKTEKKFKIVTIEEYLSQHKSFTKEDLTPVQPISAFNAVMTNKDLSGIIFAHKKNIIEEDIKKAEEEINKVKYIKLSIHKSNGKNCVLFNINNTQIDASKVHSIIRTTHEINLRSIFPNIYVHSTIQVMKYGPNLKYFVYFMTEDQAIHTMNELSKEGVRRGRSKTYSVFGPKSITKYRCLTEFIPEFGEFGEHNRSKYYCGYSHIKNYN